MKLKKEPRTGIDKGIEGRRWISNRDIIYLISLVLGTAGVGIGTGKLTIATVAADTVKQVSTTKQDVVLLKNDFDNHVEKTEEIGELKEEKIQLQIDNIANDVIELKQGHKDVMKALGKILEKIE